MIAPPPGLIPQIALSKNAMRRIAHTHRDSETKRVRFDIGRFLDRSKYNGDGTLK